MPFNKHVEDELQNRESGIQFGRLGYTALSSTFSYQPGAYLLDLRVGRRQFKAWRNTPVYRPRYLKLQLGASLAKTPRTKPRVLRASH